MKFYAGMLAGLLMGLVAAACSRVSTPQQTIRTALPVARALVELAEQVCAATDSPESCLSKCQIEAQRRAAQQTIQEVTK